MFFASPEQWKWLFKQTFSYIHILGILYASLESHKSSSDASQSSSLAERSLPCNWSSSSCPFTRDCPQQTLVWCKCSGRGNFWELKTLYLNNKPMKRCPALFGRPLYFQVIHSQLVTETIFIHPSMSCLHIIPLSLTDKSTGSKFLETAGHGLSCTLSLEALSVYQYPFRHSSHEELCLCATVITKRVSTGTEHWGGGLLCSFPYS